jgi:hypothetical protein
MHVLMAVQMGRLEPGPYHALDLRVQLAANFRRARPPESPDELAIRDGKPSVRADQARNLFGRTQRPFASDEGQMHAHVQIGACPQNPHGMIEGLAAGHDGGAGDDPLFVGLFDAAVDVFVETQVIRVDDEPARG